MIGAGALGQFALGQSQRPADGSLHPSLVTNTNTFFAPTILQEQFLTAPLLTNASTFYAPTIKLYLSAPFITNTSTFNRLHLWATRYETSQTWTERTENAETWTRVA